MVLDMLMEKFDIQVDEDTITQSMLLHSDIPGYDLPAIDYVTIRRSTRKPHTQRTGFYDIYTLRKGAHTHG